jgi:hypothetical protein
MLDAVSEPASQPASQNEGHVAIAMYCHVYCPATQQCAAAGTAPAEMRAPTAAGCNHSQYVLPEVQICAARTAVSWGLLPGPRPMSLATALQWGRRSTNAPQRSTNASTALQFAPGASRRHALVAAGQMRLLG